MSAFGGFGGGGGGPWVVLKYGGTSVATAVNWGTIVARVKALLPTNRVWVVVSALSQVGQRDEGEGGGGGC
jgi:aspartokinase